MKRNKEFYQVRCSIIYPDLNIFRIAESNDLYQAEKNFSEMLKALQKRERKDWSLTLEKHLPRNYTQIIRYRTADGETADSPLF